MGLASATLVIASRDLRKWIGRRPVLVMSLVTPLLWIALFGKSFNLQALLQPPPGVPPEAAAAIQAVVEARVRALFGTTDYFTYFASGMLVVFAVFQSLFSGVSVIFDKRLGYMDRLLVAPIPRESIFLGKILATAARTTVLAVLLLAAALALGMNLSPGAGLPEVLAALGIVALLATGLASAYSTVAFYTDNQEAVFALGNMINLPLMFTSSALFPVEQMPRWLQDIAKVNPVTYAADLVRYLLIGKPLDNPWQPLAVLAAITLALLAMGLVLSKRWMENR